MIINSKSFSRWTDVHNLYTFLVGWPLYKFPVLKLEFKSNWIKIGTICLSKALCKWVVNFEGKICQMNTERFRKQFTNDILRLPSICIEKLGKSHFVFASALVNFLILVYFYLCNTKIAKSFCFAVYIFILFLLRQQHCQNYFAKWCEEF
jgi:hypothetical protein